MYTEWTNFSRYSVILYVSAELVILGYRKRIIIRISDHDFVNCNRIRISSNCIKLIFWMVHL